VSLTTTQIEQALEELGRRYRAVEMDAAARERCKQRMLQAVADRGKRTTQMGGAGMRQADYWCDVIGLASVGITEVSVWVLEPGEEAPEGAYVRGNPEERRIAVVTTKGGSDGEGIQDGADG